MKETWDIARCASILTEEIELLKKISAAQDTVRQAVMNREWVDFDVKIGEVNRLSEKFTPLEDERVRLFSTWGNDAAGTSAGKNDGYEYSGDVETKSFYAMISGLSSEESLKLSRLYLDLKMETLKMRAMNENFLAYLNEAKTLASAYLEAVCPARGGKMYTRRGHRVSQDLRSMVFNNSF
ncbi:MAG: hypothetical protein FWC45_08285 [Treponema sp.]|nr:hypothetical protein [Treponema sp.]